MKSLILLNIFILCICLYDTYERSSWERKNYQNLWERYADLKKDNSRLEMKIDSLQRMNPAFR